MTLQINGAKKCKRYEFILNKNNVYKNYRDASYNCHQYFRIPAFILGSLSL